MSQRSPVPEWFGGSDPQHRPPGGGTGPPSGGGRSWVAFLLLVLIAGSGAAVWAAQRQNSGADLRQQLAQAERDRDEARVRAAKAEAEVKELKLMARIPAAPIPPPTAATDEPLDAAAADDTDSGPGADGDQPDRAGILKVLQRASPSFKRCYEVALAKQMDKGITKVSGRIVVTLTIAPSGSVQSASAARSGNLPQETEDCVLRVARTLHFPEASASTTLRYPLVFTAE